MKDNKLLSYDNKEEKKLNKKNYLTIIIPIIVMIIIVVILFYIAYIYNDKNNRLKRYLKLYDYTCNKSECTKKENDITYYIDYKGYNFRVEKDYYIIELSVKQTPMITQKEKDKVCTYYKESYKYLDKVDNNFEYDKECEQYIEEINNYISYYQNILNINDIDVNK